MPSILTSMVSVLLCFAVVPFTFFAENPFIMSESKEAQQTAKVWDSYAVSYSKQPIADEEAYQKKLKTTQEYFTPNSEVIEIGCGTGGTSIAHSPHVKHIIATDISPKMIDIAREKANSADIKNVDFRVAGVQDLEVAKDSKDAILALSILHLLKDKDKEDAFRRAHTWLKPGGVFVTSTICIGDMGMATRVFARYLAPVGQYFGFIPHFYAFTKQDLTECFDRHGFVIDHQWQPKKDAAWFIIGKKK